MLTIAVLILKFFPDKLPFPEKIDTSSSMTSLNSTLQQDNAPVIDTKPASIMISDNDFPQWVADQLSSLKSEATLSQWKINHPNEEVVLYSPNVKPAINIDSTWCAGTKVSMARPAGQSVARYAIFYPPVASASFALPDAKTADNSIDNQCTLGLIWIQQSESDDARGNKTALEVRDAIAQYFGKGQTDILLDRIDAKYMSQTGRWTVDDAVFISAYNTFPAIASVNKNNVRFGKKFLALGFLPLSGLHGDGMRSLGDYYEVTREEQILRIRGAVKVANILHQDGETFLTYFPAGGGTPTLEPEKAGLLMRLLERWITASEKLDKTRKAGALIAADQVLAHMEGSVGTTNIEKGGYYRRRLEKFGAKFVESPLENASVYTHSWLDIARDIDRDGPMGDLAFRIMLEMGCSGTGTKQFQDIIKEGEDYLAKNHEATSRAEVELMVAEAYRDIVALSASAQAYDEIPEVNKDMATDARQKAIMHYKNSLSILKSTTLTRGAWREAWRLIAGLPPADLRYYCVYD